VKKENFLVVVFAIFFFLVETVRYATLRRMNRHELDALLAPHTLPASEISRALKLSGNRPLRSDWRAFGVQGLGLAGMAALAAALIFFIAANWQAMGVMGRFALVQVVVLLSVGVAWWSVPARDGMGASGLLTGSLILATLASGTVLALFGQTYQTGADVYELFFAWALLTLPFALAGISGALWAVWICILNVALALFSGWHGPGDFVWAIFDHWGIDKPVAMMLGFAVNLGLAALAYTVSHTRYAIAAPAWLIRMLLTFAFVYGVGGCLYAILPSYSWRGATHSTHHFGVFAAFALVSAVVVFITLRHKRDVYPLALVAGAWIVVSTAFLIKHLLPEDLGGAFLLSVWLIAVSTAAGMVLMRYVRAWRGLPGELGASA
jgi:uncharacterized membrane protein